MSDNKKEMTRMQKYGRQSNSKLVQEIKAEAKKDKQKKESKKHNEENKTLNNKKDKKDKKSTKRFIQPLSILFGVNLIIAVCLVCGIIIYLNVLPIKYLIPVVIGIGLLTLGICLILFKKKFKSFIKIVMMIISLLIIIGSVIFSFYMYKTFNFMDKINEVSSTFDNYYVLVRKDSNYNDIKDIKGLDIGTFNEQNDVYNDAIKKLNDNVEINIKEQDSVGDLKTKLLTKKLNAVLMSNIQKEAIEADDDSFEDKVKILYTIEVEQKAVEEDFTKEVNVSKDVFTIYISGIDIFGNINQRSRSDVNMLVTVNPTTHEILLTSIPRDYYVQLHGTKGYKDKLTHAGVYGIDMSVKTIEDLMNIDINYYLRVNFSTVVKVVDIIGGIDVYSDTTFTSYVDHQTVFKKGTNHLNGTKALYFARERHAYEEGDRHRVQNQQDVITAIIKKLTSSTTLLTKYTSLLDSISSSFQTDINMNDLTGLVKLQIDTMPTWKIKKYSLDGTNDHQYTYSMGKQLLYVMQPDTKTVTQGHDYIVGMQNGKSLSSLGL